MANACEQNRRLRHITRRSSRRPKAPRFVVVSFMALLTFIVMWRNAAPAVAVRHGTPAGLHSPPVCGGLACSRPSLADRENLSGGCLSACPIAVQVARFGLCSRAMLPCWLDAHRRFATPRTPTQVRYAASMSQLAFLVRARPMLASLPGVQALHPSGSPLRAQRQNTRRHFLGGYAPRPIERNSLPPSLPTVGMAGAPPLATALGSFWRPVLHATHQSTANPSNTRPVARREPPHNTALHADIHFAALHSCR